jgi:hypothetical protein
MQQNLSPPGELTQVAFVHDYIQLVFQDWRFSLYNEVSIDVDRVVVACRNNAGFCDLLVGLLNQRAKGTGSETDAALVLTFDAGTRVIVHLADENCTWPEAWQLNTPTAAIVGHN